MLSYEQTMDYIIKAKAGDVAAKELLISENENKQQLEIVVYSQYDEEAKVQSKQLKHTEIVYIDGNYFWARLFSLKRNIINKIIRKDLAFTSYYLAKICKDINRNR